MGGKAASMTTTTKESRLIDSIVSLADEQLGGERSKTAAALFSDIADVCRKFDQPKIERIMRQVANHFIYE
jgi:hypothetical protein